MLDTVDFINLTDFLLKPYSKTDPPELHSRIEKASNIDDLKDLKQHIPESNWTRYFSDLVDCEDGYLQKRWKQLYDLRCKVAHNSIIDKSDLVNIKILVSDLEVKLQDGIKKLPQLKVPETQVSKSPQMRRAMLKKSVCLLFGLRDLTPRRRLRPGLISTNKGTRLTSPAKADCSSRG